MKFENTFVVQAPLEDVWQALMDVERVAPCMPGAEVLEQVGENEFNVAVRVKLGPMSLQYNGHVAIVERDEAARQATMHARARETRGQGNADARIGMALFRDGDGTRGKITTELQISGRPAALGRGMVADVAQKLTELFALNLAAMLEAEPTTADAPAARPDAQAVAETPGTHAQTATPVAPVATATAPLATDARRPPPAAPAESSLPIMQIAGGVIGGRLSNPRTLLTATGVLAVLFGAIGYAIGRRR